MSTEIEATYRVVTPMFCAGANRARPEIRVPSFKGVLRFWWRALAWSRLNGDLRAIRQEEDALFGSAGGGQSRLSMCMDVAVPPKPVSAGRVSANARTGRGPVGDGIRYLGYGVIGERACLRAPFYFTVRMRSRCRSDSSLETLERALIAVGLFGGMGARSRKGWGSMLMDSLRINGEERWREPRAMTDLSGRIKTFRTDTCPGGFPAYTALSKESRYLLLASEEREPLALLGSIGQELKSAVRSVPRSNRLAFGLPRKPHTDRRASPLLIHIHECSGKPVAVLSFLPAPFLPVDESSSSGRRRSTRPTSEALYRPVHGFLDRLLNSSQGKEPLQSVEVK